MKIILNACDQALCISMRDERIKSNRKAGRRMQIVTRNAAHDLEVNMDGVGGEVSFCKMVNIYPDTSLKPDSGWDLIHPTLGSIDVKQTRYKTGNLIIRPNQHHKIQPDVYALMVGTFPNYRFAGWISSEVALDKGNLGCLPGKTIINHIIPQDDLFPKIDCWQREYMLENARKKKTAQGSSHPNPPGQAEELHSPSQSAKGHST